MEGVSSPHVRSRSRVTSAKYDATKLASALSPPATPPAAEVGLAEGVLVVGLVLLGVLVVGVVLVSEAVVDGALLGVVLLGALLLVGLLEGRWVGACPLVREAAGVPVPVPEGSWPIWLSR